MLQQLMVCHAYCFKNLRHVEDCLIKSNLFNLPKNLPKGEGIDWNIVIVDATEIPIQRPKKQKKSYSGKKKPHIFKVKAIIHYQTHRILSLCTSRGAIHDFKLFKRNLNQIPIGKAIKGFIKCTK